MANRVTATEVKQIIDTSRADAVVDVFIGAANITITEILGDDDTLSTAQLKEIERWLSAHLMAATLEPQKKSESVKDASISYQGNIISGTGLMSTFYGQQVALLDTSGKLAANVGKRAASILAVTSFN